MFIASVIIKFETPEAWHVHKTKSQSTCATLYATPMGFEVSSRTHFYKHVNPTGFENDIDLKI
jgi:hypothetical protein